VIGLDRAIEIVRLHGRRRDIDSLAEEVLDSARQDVMDALVRTTATINADKLRSEAEVEIARLESEIAERKPGVDVLRESTTAARDRYDNAEDSEERKSLKSKWLEHNRKLDAAKGEIDTREQEIVYLTNTLRALGKLDGPDNTFISVLEYVADG
jgi:uncharacterized protein (DUF849 family)